MNPHPNGHKLPSALHVIGADLDDGALSRLAQHRYTCATCGWSVVADSPALMRRLAQAHHGIVRKLPVYRHIGEILAAGFRQDGTR